MPGSSAGMAGSAGTNSAAIPNVSVKTAASGGSTSSDGGASAGSGSADNCGTPSVGQARLRRLNREQYQRAVRDLLNVSFEPGADFPTDEKVAAFSSNTVTPLARLGVEQYLDAAVDIADLAVGSLDTLTSCDRSKRGDGACAADLVATLGARAYRRPLTDVESKRYTDLFASAATFEDGARDLLTTLLVSPHFLYAEELASDDTTGAQPLDAYALATRLSLTLWGSVPDASLMQAAAAGQLDTPDHIRAQAEHMLDDARAADTLASFHVQWLGLDAIDELTKEPSAYPSFDAATAVAMRAETAAFADYVFRRADGTLDTLLTSPLAFPQGPLADIYGIKPNVDPTQPVSLDPTRRAGILTQAAFLAVQAHPNQTSPVRRGVVVLRNVMCADLPNPPPNVNNATPNLDPDATTRERFAEHTASPQCAGCHTLIDPIGFGFEHYDAIGQYRTSENGMPIDSSGELTLADGSTAGFDDAIGLSKALAASPDVRKCVARQWFRYGLGRVETDADACSLAQIDDAFAASGYKLRELLLALVTSDAFRYVAGGAR
ncbi:MAG TPA: DUF1592 domain-containing protein [Polyangiaceae bacterium]|nr:DUF1592 domain-containing protein [Polyangiaceae bacterium]